MKKIAILLLTAIFLFSCATTGGATESSTTDDSSSESGDPVPYEEGEFSEGLLKLRRGEVLFFGALPLIYMFSSLGYDTYYDLVDADPPSDSNTELGQKFTITLSLSALLALADFIVGEVQDK
ncbi:MAG: hypothetical protein PQJ60_05645 [Spirochaetales bacterium]|nr:hypothetical protein [Spirochaetales bacterium]